jgi:glycine dehydrogenase subunit 2
MMFEPTETESKQSLDAYIDILFNIYEEAVFKPELLKKAPHDTPVRRLDAVTAARNPILHD